MDNFVKKIERFLMPVSEKIGKIFFLQALGQTMQIILPVYVVGGFATLLAFIDIGFWQTLLTNVPFLKVMFMTTQSLTLSIVSLYMVLVLPYRYALQLQTKNPFGVIPINLACFLLVTPTELYTNIPSEWLGYKGMFTAMIVSFLVVRVYSLFMKKGLVIKMPESVPTFVSEAFASLLPALVIVPVFALIGQLFAMTSLKSLHQAIYTLIQLPLQGVGSSFGSYMLYIIVATMSFFFGIHGMSITSVWSPIVEANSLQNLDAFSKGLPAINLFDKGTAATALIGGMTCTLSVVLVVVLLMKSKRMREVGKVSLVPGIFNIGEPILFGLPIMLNPVFLIPFFSTAVVNGVVSWVTRAIGFVQYTGLDPSWTIPMVAKAFFISQTPVRAAIVQLGLIIIDAFIWYPFLKVVDRKYLKEESDSLVIVETKKS